MLRMPFPSGFLTKVSPHQIPLEAAGINTLLTPWPRISFLTLSRLGIHGELSANWTKFGRARASLLQSPMSTKGSKQALLQMPSSCRKGIHMPWPGRHDMSCSCCLIIPTFRKYSVTLYAKYNIPKTQQTNGQVKSLWI